jgi:hypothetical protein
MATTACSRRRRSGGDPYSVSVFRIRIPYFGRSSVFCIRILYPYSVSVFRICIRILGAAPYSVSVFRIRILQVVSGAEYMYCAYVSLPSLYSTHAECAYKLLSLHSTHAESAYAAQTACRT